jgi:uncharacterized protein (TIGR02996 family)
MGDQSSPNPTEAALLAAVRTNLADSLPRLVYADWLDEQTEPLRHVLADFIRVETELARTPQDDPRGTQLIHRLIEVCEQSDRPLGGWEYAPDSIRIRQKMDALRAADPTRALFGATRRGDFGHEYRVNPPIQEADLLAFEVKLGFLLPADYRAFLLRVGSGPMGPYYGLTPLDLNQNPEPLRRTFPFSREQADQAEEALKEKRHDGLISFEDGQYGDGNLHLSEYGCGWYFLLAIVGDTRGGVWFSGDMGVSLDMTPDGTPHTFLTWYESWLDSSLKPETLNTWRSVASRR